MDTELREIIKLQKIHVHRLYNEFDRLVNDNKMLQADKWLNNFYMNANHILFMLERYESELNENK